MAKSLGHLVPQYVPACTTSRAIISMQEPLLSGEVAVWLSTSPCVVTRAIFRQWEVQAVFQNDKDLVKCPFQGPSGFVANVGWCSFLDVWGQLCLSN